MTQKKRLILLLALFALSGGAAYAAYSIPQWRYWQQFAYIVAAILLFVALALLRKYLKIKYSVRVQRFLLKMIARFRSAVRKIVDKICKKLGIKRRQFYRGAGDTASFIFSRDNNPAGAKRVFSHRPKWRDMETNAMKVRFLYLRYIVRQIKRGFGFRNSDTARQIGEKLANEDNVMLFTLYESVRYANFTGVTDEEVEYCKKLKS